MGLLRMMEVGKTGSRRAMPVQIAGRTYRIEGATRAVSDPVFQYQDEYRAMVQVHVGFFANGAQLFEATRNAHRLLARALYADALAYVDQATHEVFNGDMEAALKTLEAFRKELVE